ncbi:MAG: hypothetical protein H6828_00210 [Planctomycetes bacterium]|nr:hypothetical protein [Planctomycetota bacterium]
MNLHLLWATVVAASGPLAAGDSIGTVFCTCHDGMAAPCAVPADDTGCVNSTGVGATLLGSGSADAGADDLVLTVSNLNPGQFGIVFVGGGQLLLPFGDGVRCVSPGPRAISRFPAHQSDASGAFHEGPGLVAWSQTHFVPSMHFTAGCTYFFQGWYRDAGGPCGTTFNLTNGLGVTFHAGAPLTAIRGKVFYDYNANGVLDDIPEEGPLAGWKVRLESDCGVSEVFSDENGEYVALRDRDGLTHVVSSIAPPPGYVEEETLGRWLPTRPSPVAVVADGPEAVVDFGAAFLSNSEGPDLTVGVGHWQYTGDLELCQCDPLWRQVLNDLCLRTFYTYAEPELADQTLFLLDEAAPFCDEFWRLSDYLATSSYGVLAYQLSKQFAAANLNYHCGPLAGRTVWIDRFGTGELVSLDDMIAQTRELLCMPCAANTGWGGDEECRAMMQACLNEWEGLNSDGDRTHTISRSSAEYSFLTPY